MGRLKRLVLWCCAALMAVTAVAVGEADPAWATSPTDTADLPGGEAAAVGGAVDVSPAFSSSASGAAEAAGLRPAGRLRLVLASSHCQHGQWSDGSLPGVPGGAGVDNRHGLCRGHRHTAVLFWQHVVRAPPRLPTD